MTLEIRKGHVGKKAGTEQHREMAADMLVALELTFNDVRRKVQIIPRTSLLDLLREISG